MIFLYTLWTVASVLILFIVGCMFVSAWRRATLPAQDKPEETLIASVRRAMDAGTFDAPIARASARNNQRRF